jgi:hypothetical protein
MTYRLGQDHIEQLFCKIRSKGGFNNNPDIVSFKSALRSLLVKTEVTASSSANCVELGSADAHSSILHFTARAKRQQFREEVEEIEDDAFEDDVYQDIDLAKPVSDIVEYIGEYQD